MAKPEMESWDVFMAHAGADLPSASELAEELTRRHELVCFLDARRLEPGQEWPIRLKRALASARVVAVIVSKHSDQAFYLQEEVAIAIWLFRHEPEATRVVPVMRRGAKKKHLPYGTFSLHALQEDERGWTPVADAINGIIKTMPSRGAVASFANSLRILDDLWAGLEPALTDKDERRPAEDRMRFMADGEDLIGRFRDGHEQQRVTRSELDARLSDKELRQLHVLERSMEVNKAIWEAKYPNRVLDKRSRRGAEEAATALAEDLAGVLDLVKRSGLYLDDHYKTVRNVAGRKLQGSTHF